MNDREIFDKVKKHLLEQGERAARKDDAGLTRCRYRHVTEDGRVLKCAVGCLIPDDVYDPVIESKRVGRDEVIAVLRKSGITLDGKSDTMPMLVVLQDIHDYDPPSAWEERLDEIEHRYFGV